MDIDVKKDDFDPIVWSCVQSLTYQDIKAALEDIRDSLKALVHECMQAHIRPLNITWYKTSSKVSIRASLGLPSSIRLQAQIISHM